MPKDIEIDLSRPVTLGEIPGLFSAAVEWWRDELLSLLPLRWQKAARAEVKRSAVYVSPGQDPTHTLNTQVLVVGGDTGSIPMSGSVDVWIDPALVLRRTITLPDLPLQHLRSAIGLQIDELTPFTTKDVLFDCRVANRDRASQKCMVEAAFLPQRILSTALNKVGLDRSRVGQLGLWAGTGGAPQFRFAQDEEPKPLGLVSLRWALVYAVFVAGLFSVVWAWDYAGGYERRSLEDLIQTFKPQAEAARQANTQLRAMEAPVRALSAEEDFGAPLVVLAELSRINPETVTLVRVDIADGQVQLMGLAKNASAYLELLEKSPAFENVTFSSPVSASQTNGMERFSLNLKIARPQK